MYKGLFNLSKPKLTETTQTGFGFGGIVHLNCRSETIHKLMNKTKVPNPKTV